MTIMSKTLTVGL